MKLRLVAVEWIDITNENSWVDWEDLDREIAKEKKSVATSVGYLYSRDKKWLVILPTIMSKEGKKERVGYELIPAGCVKRVRYLKE